MSVYSQGICHDGAAILKDGVMMTVDDVVAELNRIAELELENAQAKHNIAELEAENARLREAAEQVVFECEADDDAMMPSVAAIFKLRALLGGGEK